MPNWIDVLNQISQLRHQSGIQGQKALDSVRHTYLQQLHVKTQRNVIAYYSGWLSKPNVAQTDINDEDKNGFMMAVHRLDRKKGLDLFIHTPGGNIAATHSIVNYLHKMFGNDIRAVVPQIAMSAGTMMACSCKAILMGEHSNLGPIDPQLRGVPAYGVIEEFRKAWSEIKKDPSRAHVWQPVLQQYRPTFLGQCQHGIAWSNAFVAEQLEKVMFAGERGAKAKAQQIAKKLANYRQHKGHDRHIHLEDCRAMGLKVERIEDDQQLQDLILTVHHCYMHTLMNTASFKIIENHVGSAFVKQQVQVAVPVQAAA